MLRRRRWRVAIAGAACGLSCAVAAQTATLTQRYGGSLPADQLGGPECPPPARIASIRLTLTASGDASPRFAGTLFIGDELIKAIEGTDPSALRLRDPLVAGETADANRISLDRWPDPSAATLAFQFFRYRCRVLATRVEIRPAVALTEAQEQVDDALLRDSATLAAALAAGRDGDPRPGTAEGPGLFERFGQRLGPRHGITLEARFLQMVNAQDTGALEQAAEIGEELLRTRSELYGAESPQTARLKVALGYTAWQAGRSAEAIDITQSALASMAATIGKADPYYLTVLVTQANYLAWSSRHAEALAAAREAEQIARSQHGPDSLPRLNAVRVLGQANLAAGRAEEARELLITVLPIARNKLGVDHPLYIDLVHLQGVVAADLRLYDESNGATAFVLQQREKTLGPDNSQTITALVNLAVSRADQRDYQEAERLFLLAYERIPKKPGFRRDQIAGVELSLALLYLELANMSLAGEYTDKAVRRTREYYGELDARTLQALTARAEWLTRTGAPRAALDILRPVHAQQESVGGSFQLDELQTLSQMAAAHGALGERTEAKARLEKLVATAELQRDDVRADAGNRRRLLRRWVADYKQLAGLRLGQGDLEGAFALAELSKGRTLLDQMSERIARTAGGLTAAERNELLDLETRILGAEQQLSDVEPASPRAAELVATLAERRTQYRAVKSEIERKHPHYAELTRLPLLDAAQARGLLQPTEVAVSYLVTRDAILAFVLTNSAFEGARLPLSAAQRASIDAYPKMAAKPAPDTGYRLWELADGSRIWSVARPETDSQPVAFSALSRELGRLLLEPLRPHLARKSRVLISPDGLLAAVPYELLKLDETLLGDRHAVHYAQSLSVYARIQQRAKIAPKSERRSLLAVGAPTFGTERSGVADGFADASSRYRTAGLEWKPLPGAQKEIESVARYFSGARTLIGDLASEENLQELNTAGELTRFRYIHFATHAYFSGDSPDLSAIVLRQPGSERADGYLTIAELPRYRLDSDLVVLSACETATGRSVDGEGVMGFAYALLIAGNRSTVAALWKVPDEATALFMQKFFAGVRRGESHADALAKAKRDLQRVPRFSAPLNWAGFILYGV